MSDAVEDVVASAPPDAAEEAIEIDLDSNGARPRSAISRNAALSFDDWQKIVPDALKFENRLRHLRNSDKGKMANLRRNSGNTLAEARGVAWIEAWLGGDRRQHDEQYFLVATLFDQNRATARNEDFGATMRRVAGESSDSFERRFTVLLDATFDELEQVEDGSRYGGGELAYRLGQMVKLAASKKIGIDWTLLLTDLCCWNMAGKPVQKKWARNFYAPGLEADEDRTSAVFGEAAFGEAATDQK